MLDNLLLDRLTDHFIAHFRRMLRRNQNVVHSQWNELATLLLVLDDDLRLAVGAQPRDSSVFSFNSHLFAELVGQVMGIWVERLVIPLVSGVAKH